MIKITYITHACLLIEINKIKILTDPWLTGPSWGGSLWHYPMHNYAPSNLPTPDIIFFSHGHDDHFHEETISNFPKNWFNSKIVAPNYNVSWWEGELKKKFKNILFLKHDEILDFKNNIKFQMFLNNDGEFDASLKIKDSNNCIFLQTDNLMNKKEALRIAKIDKIDIAFVIPFLSGVFPGFYKWDTDTLIKLSNEKIHRSLNYCSDIVKFLKPKFTIPYACDLGYLGDNFHINLIHRNNKHDLIKTLKKRKIKTRSEILSSGDTINISKDKVKFKLKNNKTHNEFESLIRFSNEMSEKFQEYKIKEAKVTNPNLNALTKIFVNNLRRNIKNIENFNFKVQIDIKENDKKKSMLINFKTKSIKAKLKIKEKVDLKMNIESTKIRNLLLTKYPMNFMTFHNGGYTCERKVLSLTNNEKKYWSWINNLDFFI